MILAFKIVLFIAGAVGIFFGVETVFHLRNRMDEHPAVAWVTGVMTWVGIGLWILHLVRKR